MDQVPSIAAGPENQVRDVLQWWSVLLQVFSDAPKFSADIEPLRAQLRHFMLLYGWSAQRIGVHLRHDPTMVHRILRARPFLALR